jgi:hypothetical protein
MSWAESGKLAYIEAQAGAAWRKLKRLREMADHSAHGSTAAQDYALAAAAALAHPQAFEITALAEEAGGVSK